ncbi:MAG: response regulator transcription factor [Polyangiaceae bacterium]|nr:response regulator transcription factor [Polyangiaceae bacterium]
MDIVLVEDDTTLSDVIAMHLRAEGFRVRAAADGEAALDACAAQRPDVVLLDVMLPKKTGLEVCAELRRLYGASPGVVMLTALGSEADVVCGLDAGADDYVVKPIRPRELLARVRSLGRRIGAVGTTHDLAFGPLRVSPSARQVKVHEATVRLTATEWDLLFGLVSEPLRVFSRAELLSRVFDTTHAGYARNVDCHVTRVRRKLEGAGLAPAPIETVHGQGYRFVPPC